LKEAVSRKEVYEEQDMPALADADRVECWADLMRRADVGSVSLTKAELRAVVNALDDWVVTNAAALNTAIPQPGRGALTTAQKALILSAVVLKRYEKGA
jgi:hypothetical protein